MWLCITRTYYRNQNYKEQEQPDDCIISRGGNYYAWSLLPHIVLKPPAVCSFMKITEVRKGVFQWKLQECHANDSFQTASGETMNKPTQSPW